MAILVIAEHNNAVLAAATLNTVAAAKAIGGDIHVLVAGQNVAAVAEAAAKVEGVSKVLVADNAPPKAVRLPSSRFPVRPMPASPPSSAKSWPSPTVRN